MKQYNLAGEEIDAGLRAIGAIQEIDRGPEGRFAMSIQCDGLPLRDDAVLLIDSRKLHWTEYKRKREQRTDRRGNPMYDGIAHCNRCGHEAAPEYNARGKSFECSNCSCIDITKVAGRKHVHVEHKTLKGHFKRHHSPKPVLR